MLTVEEVRQDIPILKDTIYMDCAATSPMPRPVFESIRSYWEECPFNYGRSLAFFEGSKEVSKRCNIALENIAGLINAEPSEIVFTKNTTEGLNIVAHGFDFNPGDEVIISNIEHQSNFIPWLFVGKQKNVKVNIAHANAEGIITPEEIEQTISEKTRLISLIHASNIFGSIQDVKTIAKIAHDHSALLLIDGAQTAGRLPIDVKEIDCDFMAMCGRKSIMGPQGTGALYGKKELLEQLSPPLLGGGAADLQNTSEFTLGPVPHRFHAGIYNAMGIIGLGRAAEYVGVDIGVDNIRSHIRRIFNLLQKGFEQIPSIRFFGPKDTEKQNGVISFNVGNIDSREVVRLLDANAHIIVAGGSHGSPTVMQQIGEKGTVRASLQYYNTEEDVNNLLSTLENMKG